MIDRQRFRSWTLLSAIVLLTGLVLPACSRATEPAAQTKPGGELGRWVTESGNLEIEIAQCGEALCGTVVRVLGNRSMSGPGAIVATDPRPALGMQILSDLRPTGAGTWKGSIYNRENAKSYGCVMTLLDPGQLQIRAYKGLPLFGKTQIWRRAAEPAQSSQ